MEKESRKHTLTTSIDLVTNKEGRVRILFGSDLLGGKKIFRSRETTSILNKFFISANFLMRTSFKTSVPDDRVQTHVKR